MSEKWAEIMAQTAVLPHAEAFCAEKTSATTQTCDVFSSWYSRLRGKPKDYSLSPGGR